MKKLIALVLVAMILGTTLVGCGGTTTTKATTPVTDKDKQK